MITKNITNIISSIQSQPRLNPTEIYNEGWMTRLLVYNSVQHGISIKGIDFKKLSNWTSEALISSPFVFAKERREGYTHADMALGDFTVDYRTRGEVVIDPDAWLFGIIEAKMGSNLSQGTTTVPKRYNQASRNVACIASQVYNNDCNLFFGVVAPEDILSKHDIDAQLSVIEKQITERFAEYDTNDAVRAEERAILEKVRRCSVWMLSYEEWIQLFESSRVRNDLYEFYQECRRWNRLKPLG